MSNQTPFDFFDPNNGFISFDELLYNPNNEYNQQHPEHQQIDASNPNFYVEYDPQQPSTSSNYSAPVPNAFPEFTELQTSFEAPVPNPVPARTNVSSRGKYRSRKDTEKCRRQQYKKAVEELAAIVPQVVALETKPSRTRILQLAAHYLRANDHVFGDTIHKPAEMSIAATNTLLKMFNGFVLTVTYKGMIVVVSENVAEYLGYTQAVLIGQNIVSYVHKDDVQVLKENLYPQTVKLGKNGKLIIPDSPDGLEIVKDSLSNEKRRFFIRMKHQKCPNEYVKVFVEGFLRKADRACSTVDEDPSYRQQRYHIAASGNDVVFIGVCKPVVETFIKEREIEAHTLQYSTRHTIDGAIIQTQHQVALVTGYLRKEVIGKNAFSFMHKDDCRWVAIALRKMYDDNSVVGESFYRLIAKSGEVSYMYTTGQLEKDPSSSAVTTFRCMNTVLGEQVGKLLVNGMREKYSMNNQYLPETSGGNQIPEYTFLESTPDSNTIEDVVNHLTFNLPSPTSMTYLEMTQQGFLANNCEAPLAIIPPQMMSQPNNSTTGYHQ